MTCERGRTVNGLAMNVPCVVLPPLPVWAAGWGPCGSDGWAGGPREDPVLPPSPWQELFAPLRVLAAHPFCQETWSCWEPRLSSWQSGPAWRGPAIAQKGRSVGCKWRPGACLGDIPESFSGERHISVGSMEKQNGSWGYQTKSTAEEGEMILQKCHFSSLVFVD